MNQRLIDMPCSKYKGKQRGLCYATKEWTVKPKGWRGESKRHAMAARTGKRQWNFNRTKKRPKGYRIDHLNNGRWEVSSIYGEHDPPTFRTKKEAMRYLYRLPSLYVE